MGGWRVIITRIVLFVVFVPLLGLLVFVALQSEQRKVIKERISFGEKSLFPEKPSSDKKAVMKAIADGNLSNVKNQFDNWVKNNGNDPEALIFFNNANIGYNPSYIIAVSVPITKDINDIDINNSLEILRGVAQAQYEINNDFGGIKGVRLKVAIASDDNDPEVAKQVATALVNNRNVLGVVGHYASDVTLAAKDIYTSGKLVAITPISTSVCLTKTFTNNSICPKDSDRSKNSEPYIFRTVPSDSDTANALADYMFNKLNTNNNAAIFFNPDSNYSKSLKSEFMTVVKNKGGQVSKEFKLNERNFDATSKVKQAIEQDTQVIMLAADTKTLPKALQVVRAAKEKNLKILAGDDVYTPDTFKEDTVVGMVVTAFWHIDNNSKSSFVKKSKELWGKGAEVNWRTALAYDATQALITAIEKQNPNPTRSKIQQALLSKDFKTTGASGDIEFLPSGDRKIPKVELVQIVPTNNSNTPYKFVPVAAHKDKPSGDYPGSPTNNNSSPTRTPSPLTTATPISTSTPTPSSSTTSLASDSVCRLQPESPESYKADVVQNEGVNLRAEPREDSKRLGVLNPKQRIIILKDKEDKTWKNICVEVKGTKLEDWVKAKDKKGKDNTKKVVE
ncbi:MAG: ABC transporter substrate-binding protein [Brasilonema octagenarum HA4186-MV1]|jgi:branched-chain amino acid transport system substrate-binding protein|nr:ABC transporter substrate-binding protein [Brasilonema octagenarum HA4186-MV1]